MNLRELNQTRQKLTNFITHFRSSLGRSERLHWCQMYLSGLLLNGERKSIQPIAERLPGGNEQALQQFVNQSPWEHEPLQIQLAQYLVRQLQVKQGVLVLDDTSLPKKGEYSIGVARQYCGALGKVANCQSVVTWHYAQKNGLHFPLIGELYLPEAWIQDRKRLKQSGVPKRRFTFKKKWELALELLDTLQKETIPYEALVFDAGYGEIKEFLRRLDERKEIFLAQIPESHAFWPMDVPLTNQQLKVGRPRCYHTVKDKKQKPLSAKQWRLKLISDGVKWKSVPLSHSSKKTTQACAIRVKEVMTQAYYRPGKDYWLIIEKLGVNQYKYYVSNAPEKTPLKTLVEWAHERWKVEQGYQQLKEELGLDHFEGRSWRGLHHHITLCFMAYGFLLLLRQTSLKKT